MKAVSLIDPPVSVHRKNSSVYFTRSKDSFKGSKPEVLCKEAPSFLEEIDSWVPKRVCGKGPKNSLQLPSRSQEVLSHLATKHKIKPKKDNIWDISEVHIDWASCA